jgi:DNA mismatch endonuclease (patch repair protein)
MPKSRVGFWKSKLTGNKARDARASRELQKHGWRVLIIWECQISPRRLPKLASRISKFLA